MLCKLATALSKWKAAPFLGLSQTGPRLPLNAFVLSIIFPSSMDSHIPFVVDLIFPLVHSLEVSDLVFMQFDRVLVNCQNRRNCDVPGAAGFEPGSMRQRLKHRLRTQSRTSPHLLLQLTNPDMSRLTSMDDPSSQRFFSNSKALPNIHGTGTQLYFLLQAHII